jgi:hypothetical protein
MIRRFSLVSLCAVAVAAPVAAQLPSVALDASVGAKSGAQRAALSAWHPVFNFGGRLHLGLGARVSGYAGDPVGYTNRDSVQGNQTASLTIKPAVYALNGAVFAQLDLIGAIAVGMNLDVIGVATGKTLTAGSLTEKPQAFSYFRYGSADHGALNSEFFVSVRVSPRVNVRAGSSHYVTNYEVTDSTAPGVTTRYQKFQTVPFVALRLRL